MASGLVELSLADVAKAGGLDRASVDQRALLQIDDGAGELAVEVGHPGEEPLAEAEVELLAHRGVPVQAGVVFLPVV
jgi:hypothetical protein